MKKLISLVVILAMGGAVMADENSEETKVNFDLSLDVFGKYIFRGMNRVDEPVFQPNFSVNYGGLTGCVWGNMDLTDVNGNDFNFSEYDYSLEYTSDSSGHQVFGLEVVGYTLGAVHYDYPGSEMGNTTEVYWGLDFDLPLDPSVKVYHDLQEADGTYGVVKIGHSMEKITISRLADADVGLNLGLSVGMGTSHFNDYYWGLHQSKMTDLNFSLSLPIEKEGWIITPSLNYVRLLSDDIQAAKMYDTDSDYVFFGISLATKF